MGVGCLGWAVAGVAVIALIGQCSDDVPTTNERREVVPLPVLDWRYVQPASANCRSEAGTSSASVARLERNERVGVMQSEGGWSLISRSDDCWIRNDLLSDEPVIERAPIRGLSSAGQQRITEVARQHIFPKLRSGASSGCRARSEWRSWVCSPFGSRRRWSRL